MPGNSASSSPPPPHTLSVGPDSTSVDEQQPPFGSVANDEAHTPIIMTGDQGILPSSPLSLLPEDDAQHSQPQPEDMSDFGEDAEDAVYELEEEDDSYTGQHASIVTASAILSRSGAVFPFPVNYPAAPRAHTGRVGTNRSSGGQYRSERPAESRSRRESLDDFAADGNSNMYEQGEQNEEGQEGRSSADRRVSLSLSASSHSSTSSSALTSELPSSSPINFSRHTSGQGSSRRGSIGRSLSPYLHFENPGSTWLPPLDIGGHSAPSRSQSSNLANRSSASAEDRSRTSSNVKHQHKQQQQRPRPRQRPSNGSAFEALGTLLLHSREAKGRPSVLSFARPESVISKEDEAGLWIQRGSDDNNNDGTAYSAAGRKQSDDRTRSNSESEPMTPHVHAPSSFLFGNSHRRVRTSSVRSERSSSSVSRDDVRTAAPPAGSADSFSMNDDPDDRSQWFRRFFGPPSAKAQQHQHNHQQQTLNLPFGLRFPAVQNSSLLTAKGRSNTLTIAERRARRFLLGRQADDSDTTDPSYRLVWTRRNQPSFQVERKPESQALAKSRPPSLSPSRKESVDDSALTPTLHSPPFRRAQSEMPRSIVPRPTFPRACDEPEPPSSLLYRRKRGKRGNGAGDDLWQSGGGEGSPPATSLAGILGPSSMMDLPEPPPSPLAMPGGWVGSNSYRRSGRRAWLWWEGKGDESPNMSFESPRGGGAGGSRGMVRKASTGSMGSPNGSLPQKGGLLSLPRLPSSSRGTTSGSRPAKRRAARSSNHLYEEGALWLPPPLLDDVGSNPASFEGLLGIKRMREREQALKQLERLRARNRPTNKPGLITALGNFVKAAHAAELSHKKMRQQEEIIAAAAGVGSKKRPGIGALGGAWRSLSAFELGQGASRPFAGRSAPADVAATMEEADKANDAAVGEGEGGDEVGNADADEGELEDEEVDEQPGTRLWWDRLFSNSRVASGAAWAMGTTTSAKENTEVELRPSMADRSFTEPAFKRSIEMEIEDEETSAGKDDMSSFILDSGPPSASASRRKMNGSTSSTSVAAPFASQPLSTLAEGQGTDFSTEFAISASSPRLSGESARSVGGLDSTDMSLSESGVSSQGTASAKHVLFSTPLESPRLRGSCSGSGLSDAARGQGRSATLPSRISDSRLSSPMRELPHAPRLVPIHISNPTSPMTPLISDVLDPFMPNGEGRRRSGSGSFIEVGSPLLRSFRLAGESSAPRAPRLAPTLMSLPPSPWTESGDMSMTPVGGSMPKRRSISTLSPMMRMDALIETDSDGRNGGLLNAPEEQQQISFRLSAEIVRSQSGEGGLSSISPRLVPRKLEVIASPLLRASQAEDAADDLNGSVPNGLGIVTSNSVARQTAQKRGVEAGSKSSHERFGTKSDLSRGSTLATEARLTPAALFLSKPEGVPLHRSETSTRLRIPQSRNLSQSRVPLTGSLSSTSNASQPRMHRQPSRMAKRQPERSFFLWLLIGDLFLGTSPSIAAKAIDPSKTPPGTVEFGPIAGVISHLVGFIVFTLAHVLDLATNAWENTTRAIWFIRWLGLNLTGQTVLSRCIYEVFLLVRDEWNTVAEEDHEDRAGKRGKLSRGRSRRGSWSGSAAAGAGEEDGEERDGFDLQPVDSSGEGKKRGKPKGLSKWQIVRGLTELACLQAVTRERYLAEGAGLEKLRGWKKRRKGSKRSASHDRGGDSFGQSIDPAAYSNTSTITHLSLDRNSSDDDSDDDNDAYERRARRRREASREEDGKHTAEGSPVGSLSSDDSDESETEMIVTRQDADVLEFCKTPRPMPTGEGPGGRPGLSSRQSSAGASSYFHMHRPASPPSGSGPDSSATAKKRTHPAMGSAFDYGMTPLLPQQSASSSSNVHVLPASGHDVVVEEEEEDSLAAGRPPKGAEGRRGSLIDQGRKHGALWSDSARDLVKTMRWASRMAISAYGLHVHIVDLPPTFTPSGKRFNRQTFAHLSRLNPDDVLHAEIQTLDSEAAYQPTFYIVRDFVRKVIVVSVRGTQSFSDIIVDLDINVETVALPALKTKQSGEGHSNSWNHDAKEGIGPDDGTDQSTEWIRDPRLKAHAGIWRAAQSLIKPGSTLFDTLKATMEELSDFGLVLTGHSLGAAIASAVALLISEYKPVDEHSGHYDDHQHQKRYRHASTSTEDDPGRGVWLTRPGTGLPTGRPIRAIAFAHPATVSAALADRAGLGIIPLVTTVVLGSDVIPRAGHGQARELRRVLGALSRVRRRHAFQSAKKGHGEEEEEEDARVHIVRSWWDWRSICSAAAEAESAANDQQSSGVWNGGKEDDSARAEHQHKVRAPISVKEMMSRSKRLSLAGLDAVTLDRKERIEDQLWKLRCDVEADLYAAVKGRMAGADSALLAGLRTPGLSPWVGPWSGRSGGAAPLHKLASRRQKLDMATLASEVREEERAEGGRVMLLPAGKSFLIESGEIYVVTSPLSYFSLPDLTPKMLADHLPSAYEAAMEEDIAL
ncbi:hypothetical protein A4X09_0g341 [Tilletia walkeri]|uniref:sn-1-specific diacylglycerol lipase n=1 Tax=Tilletia walkeri TaxID=117179 RepID=A0A8X7T947_9BASI|nr:hypothetical protein A4X09_0g341 [Tilletia walkeri]